MSLEYWLDLGECVCGSRNAIGGCRYCDLKLMLEFTDEVAALVKEVERLRIAYPTTNIRRLMHEIRINDPLQ